MLDLDSLTRLERACFTTTLKILIAQDVERLTSYQISQERFEGVPKPFLRMALQGLVSKGLFVHVVDEDSDPEGWFAISPKYASEIYEFVENDYAISVPGRVLDPDPGLFIPLDAKGSEVRKVDALLEKLSESVKSSNELVLELGQRLAVMSELNGIRSYLKEPRIRASTLIQAVTKGSVLLWLFETTSSAVIRDLASKALNTLLKILQG